MTFRISRWRALWLVVCSTAFAHHLQAQEEALFSVGTRTYKLSDLAGKKEDAFLKECREELNNLSLEALLKKPFITEEKRKEILALPEGQRREAVEKLLCRRYLAPLVRVGFRMALFAGITDRIVADFQVDLEDYFDIEVLRATVRRYKRFSRFRSDAIEDPAADERTLAVMNKAMGWKYDKATWMKSRAHIRGRGQINGWEGIYHEDSPHYESLAWKAALAHALLNKACTQGIYRKQAVDLLTVQQSLFMSFLFKNYQGDPRHLEAFVRVVFKDGNIDDAGIDKMKGLMAVLKNASPALDVHGAFPRGKELITHNAALPVGKLISLVPGTYVAYAYMDKRSAEKMGDTFIVNESFPMGALDYFPDVAIYAKDLYSLDPMAELSSLTSDGLLVAVGLEMAYGEYIKKPFPAEPFAQNRACRAAIQSAVFEGLTAQFSGDKKAAAGVVERLRKSAKDPANPGFVQLQYRRAGDGLVSQLKLEPSKK